MRLAQIKAALEHCGVRPSRALGQNFLCDANMARKIVRAAAIRPGDSVLEVGPGLGALTAILIEAGARVRAIEKDRRLAAALRQRFGGADNLELIEADAAAFLRRSGADWDGWKLVSNLPYSAASPILAELALSPRPPLAMVATVQKEVADRIRAAPGTKDFGVLTALLRFRFRPVQAFPIPPQCFYPRPDVDSVCLRLERLERPLAPPSLLPAACRLVKKVFSQRRKKLAKLLRDEAPPARLRRILEEAGISEDARPEQATPEQYAALARALSREESP